MRATITKRRVDAMRPGDLIADDTVRGFVARRLPSGTVVYAFRYRDKVSKAQRWLSLGQHGPITPDQARALAQGAAGKVAGAADPVADQKAARAVAKRSSARTVDGLLDDFMRRYVSARALRSAEEIGRTFKVYVRPVIGAESIYTLRRSRIAEMLDGIEDNNGPVMADRTLAHLRKAFAWHATRDDDFNSPIVRGMARTKPQERARDRILADDEIRDLWRALDKVTGPYPGLVRCLLLTAQRCAEVGGMRRREITGLDWLIPPERVKGKAPQLVPLPEAAAAIIEAQPVWLDTKGKPDREADYVFSRAGRGPYGGFSASKRKLDLELAKIRKAEGRGPMAPWVLHDLRRTGRSLMARAGVASDVAERVLGHVIPGVRGVYDRHAYTVEKRDALKRLAAVVAEILEPPPAGKVVKLRA